MREKKFRAWVEKTIDVRFNWAYDEAEKEFANKEPRNHNHPSWDMWYEEKERFLDSKLKEWDCYNKDNDRYIKVKEMTTDIMINGKIQRPYRYEIIEVMQYVGKSDKNGNEICEDDIVLCETDWNEDGYYENSRIFILEDIKDVLYQLECVDCCEIIGNRHENPELINKN